MFSWGSNVGGYDCLFKVNVVFLHFCSLILIRQSASHFYRDAQNRGVVSKYGYSLPLVCWGIRSV